MRRSVITVPNECYQTALPLERTSLGEDPFVQLGIQAVLRHDVDLDVEKGLGIPAEVEVSFRHAPAVLDLHEEIEIALGSACTPRPRSEDAQIADAVPVG